MIKLALIEVIFNLTIYDPAKCNNLLLHDLIMFLYILHVEEIINNFTSYFVEELVVLLTDKLSQIYAENLDPDFDFDRYPEDSEFSENFQTNNGLKLFLNLYNYGIIQKSLISNLFDKILPPNFSGKIPEKILEILLEFLKIASFELRKRDAEVCQNILSKLGQQLDKNTENVKIRQKYMIEMIQKIKSNNFGNYSKKNLSSAISEASGGFDNTIEIMENKKKLLHSLLKKHLRIFS